MVVVTIAWWIIVLVNTTAYGERIFVRYISSGEESGGRRSTDFSCTL